MYYRPYYARAVSNYRAGFPGGPKVYAPLGAVPNKLTADQIAVYLIDFRRTLSIIWPEIKKKTPQLSNDAKKAWNRVVWNLIDMELTFIAELSKEGVKAPDGRPLSEAFNADMLHKKLPVGDFAGVGLGVIPIITTACVGTGLLVGAYTAGVGGPLAYYACNILGIAIAGTILYKLSKVVINEILGSDIEKQKEGVDLFNRLVRDGLTPAEAAKFLVEQKKTSMPGWAKGMIAAGAVAGGLWVLWMVTPAVKTLVRR